MQWFSIVSCGALPDPPSLIYIFRIIQRTGDVQGHNPLIYSTRRVLGMSSSTRERGELKAADLTLHVPKRRTVTDTSCAFKRFRFRFHHRLIRRDQTVWAKEGKGGSGPTSTFILMLEMLERFSPNVECLYILGQGRVFFIFCNQPMRIQVFYLEKPKGTNPADLWGRGLNEWTPTRQLAGDLVRVAPPFLPENLSLVHTCG